MNKETEHLEEIGQLVDKYLEMFGRARVAFYCIPFFEDPDSYSKYMNSFSAALKRANCRPVHAMSIDANRGCYNIFLMVQGYFRNSMNDVTDAAQRIMRLYSPFPIQLIADLPVNISSIDQDKMRIFDVMNKIDFIPSNPQKLLPPHMRTFAISKL